MSNIVERKSITAIVPSISKNTATIYDAHMSLSKFRDYSKNDEINKISEQLVRWSFNLGLSEKLSKEELILTTKFILDNYPTLNIVDLKSVVSLSVKDQEFLKIESYGKLSPIYIGKCLNLWENIKKDIVADAKQKINKVKSLEPIKEPTREERIANIKQIIINAKEDALKGTYEDYGDIVYDFVKARKLVLIDEKMKNDALSYGRDNLKKQKHKSNLASVVKKINFTKLDDEAIVRKGAREFIVNYWLGTKTMDEMKTYINTIK